MVASTVLENGRTRYDDLVFGTFGGEMHVFARACVEDVASSHWWGGNLI